jgi:hypothetical protein
MKLRKVSYPTATATAFLIRVIWQAARQTAMRMGSLILVILQVGRLPIAMAMANQIHAIFRVELRQTATQTASLIRAILRVVLFQTATTTASQIHATSPAALQIATTTACQILVTLRLVRATMLTRMVCPTNARPTVMRMVCQMLGRYCNISSLIATAIAFPIRATLPTERPRTATKIAFPTHAISPRVKWTKIQMVSLTTANIDMVTSILMETSAEAISLCCSRCGELSILSLAISQATGESMGKTLLRFLPDGDQFRDESFPSFIKSMTC